MEVIIIHYAHSVKDKEERFWQLLSDHLINVAKIAGEFADAFGSYHLGFIAGLYHDMGKYSYEFQQRIRGKNIRVDHSTAGGQEIAKVVKSESVRTILAFVILCHHGGLLDYGSVENGLCQRLAKAIPDYAHYKADHQYMADMAKCIFDKMPRLVPTSGETRLFSIFLYIKMLYSCLVDADHLDTEKFCDHEKYQLRAKTDDIHSLSVKFNDYMHNLMSQCEKTPINVIRQKILNDCIKMGSGQKGIYTLTVPTGGGKTLASMAFALEHIKAHANDQQKLRRIIYVIPFTSIIEQNADVFRRIFEEENVLEHHSNYEYSGNDEGTRIRDKLKLSSENWDIPIVVTTNVQFFESIFSCKKSANRKLHNIANSIIIFDEAQMFSTEYLKPCLFAIDDLSADYGCTAVLCTATQPALQDYFPKERKIMEIIENPQRLTDQLARAEIKNIGTLNDIALAEKLFSHKQALCIVNTKKHAYNIYNELKRMADENGEEGSVNQHIYHLSTNMYPHHRRKVIAGMKERLKKGERIHVISTQLIEAGVDIDFPFVYRSIAGIDSIIQAAGRCNREGKLNAGQCYVFESNEAHAKTRGFLNRTAGKAKEIIDKYNDKAFTLDAIKDYFSLLYALEGERLDNKEIIKDIDEMGQNLHFPFESISQKFKLIEDDTVSIIIPDDEKAKKLIDEARHSLFPGSYARLLQGYTVNIFKYEFKNINKVVECGVADIYNVLMDTDMYDGETGLKKVLQIDDFIQ